MLNQTNEICHHGFISENGLLFGLAIDIVPIIFFFGFLMLSGRYFVYFAPTRILIVVCLIIKDIVYIIIGIRDWVLFDLCLENRICVCITSAFIFIFMFILIYLSIFFHKFLQNLEKNLNKKL